MVYGITISDVAGHPYSLYYKNLFDIKNVDEFFFFLNFSCL